MLFKKALALTVSALVCLTVFAPLGISAASEPVHTVYRLPEYAEKAKASNATAEDAKKDLEGLQTMRTLGQNMAWMLKNMENGAEHPEYEKRLRTDFIRR